MQKVLRPRGQREREGSARAFHRRLHALDRELEIVDRLAGSPVESSIEPPTQPASAARAIAFAAVRIVGAAILQVALTGRSVASALIGSFR